MVDDEELLELVEMVKICSQAEFPDDDTPIVTGSALRRWKGMIRISAPALSSSWPKPWIPAFLSPSVLWTPVS